MTIIRCDVCEKHGATAEGGGFVLLPVGWIEIQTSHGSLTAPQVICSTRCYLTWGQMHMGVTAITDGLGGLVFAAP